MWKFISILLLVLSGCSSYRPFVLVRPKTEDYPKPRAEAVTVLYAESVFQDRFMSIGGIVAFVIFAGPVDAVTLGQAGMTSSLNDAVYTPAERTEVRHEKSEYEKLLGDYDALADFNAALRRRGSGCTRLKISLGIDPVVNGTVIDVLKDPSVRDGTRNPAPFSKDLRARLQKLGSSCVLGVKYSYGLGARSGKEQFGFSKYYRPFVKLIGVLVDTETGEILWRNFLIVFDDTGYRGGDSDVENLNRETLTAQFKDINGKLVSLLIDCLNGKSAPDMPFLTGLSPKLDFTF